MWMPGPDWGSRREGETAAFELKFGRPMLEPPRDGPSSMPIFGPGQCDAKIMFFFPSHAFLNVSCTGLIRPRHMRVTRRHGEGGTQLRATEVLPVASVQ